MLRDTNVEWPLDEVIEIAEYGLAIVESYNLEPRHLPTSLYMDLSHYYNVKAVMLSQVGRNAEAHASSQRAISLLNSILATDKAINELARQSALRRGKKPDEIPDVGSPGIYPELGHAYLEEGQLENALQMFRYMRHISPLDPFAHFCEGTALGKTGRLEESSISLIKAFLFGWPQQRILDFFVAVHQQLSGDLSAVVSDGTVFTLNVGNPFVRKHLDQAVTELIQELVKTEHQTAAKQIRDTAVSKFGFSQPVLDQLLK